MASLLAAALVPAVAQETVAIPTAAPTALAEAAQRVSGIALDPGACYRVRDVALDRGDLRFYFTDGWVIFAKPVQIAPNSERVMAAIFVRASSGDDAEIAVLPPSPGERMSLARFTGTPNLNEHLDTVLMLFTDDTAAEIQLAIKNSNHPEPSREQGLLLQDRFGNTLVNLTNSFRLRLVENMASAREGRNGFFYAAMVGRKLGNFDALYDPMAPRSVFVGQLSNKQNRTFYDVWTTFPARALRSQRRVLSPNVVSENRIQATLAADLHMDVTSTAVMSFTGEARVIVFDLSNRMSIASVTIDGEPAEFFNDASLRSNLIRADEVAQILVMPAHPLEPNRPHEVKFVYSSTLR